MQGVQAVHIHDIFGLGNVRVNISRQYAPSIADQPAETGPNLEAFRAEDPSRKTGSRDLVPINKQEGTDGFAPLAKFDDLAEDDLLGRLVNDGLRLPVRYIRLGSDCHSLLVVPFDLPACLCERLLFLSPVCPLEDLNPGPHLRAFHARAPLTQ